MGLFDFAANIGESLFGSNDSKEDAANKVKARIEKNNPGIENLKVEMNEDKTISLSGDAASAEALEKAVLIAGNVEGVEKVKTDSLQAPETSSKVEYYTIQKGDTLSGIAKEKYGDSNKYKYILEANEEVIENADNIYPGQKIRLPEAV